MNVLLRLTVMCMCCAVLFAQPPVNNNEAALDKRFNAFVMQVRCLVCQNESLAESRAELAVDLRREIRNQMKAGRSDDEIRAFLTERYGEFVLYRPPLKFSTYPLWFGPFILLAVACGTMYRVVTRRTSYSRPASAGQRRRAQQLLDGEV
jgi:cytochrome c-type biogenesis protein CcmH